MFVNVVPGIVNIIVKQHIGVVWQVQYDYS